MKLQYRLPLFILTLILVFTACDENDKFSSNSNLVLEFSRETLRFDTVFTTIASPMQRFQVFNRNNNSITFESIEIMHPEKSGFRINVNGRAGTKFLNEDLLRKDSLYILVDVKAKERLGADALLRDSIKLTWNGNTKYIQLGAYGIDTYIWDDKTIDSDVQLRTDKDYYIRGAVTIAENTSLSIPAGVTLYFDKKGSMTINGNIYANGTAKKPVVFRGHRFDFIERSTPYDNASDQWIGITVGENSFYNLFNNVRIRNSKVGIDFLPSTSDQNKATLINTVIHNTSERGLKAVNAQIDAVNCLFSNSKGALLTLIGGNYSFRHCTIANYYVWHARTVASVVLRDGESGNKYPLKNCVFTNSIIAGSFKDELSINVDKTAGSTYLFNNNLIQTSREYIDAEFVNNIWNITSMFPFKNINSEKRFFYSFELTEKSTARDVASIAEAQSARTDLRDVSRFADSKPDLGCYEWAY